MSLDGAVSKAWYYAIHADEVEEQDVMPVDLNGQAIAVYRIKDQFYATQDTCTHAQASLSEGVVIDDVIECPIHQGRFCIRTGEPKGGPVTVALRTFPTKEENGRIFVQITQPELAELGRYK